MLPVILIYMNIKITATILFLSLLAFPAFAMDYPQFGGITLNKDTTAAQYIIYFFNLAVAIGAFIAVVMVIMAGIEWVTSGGEPSKVTSAKGKIVNTLFGVCVLMGCYFILNTINPELTNINIDDLNCENGIVLSVMRGEEKKVKDFCVSTTQGNITDTIISTKKWNFPEGQLLKAYAYTGPSYTGTYTEYNCKTGSCSGEIPTGTKSIYFVLNSPGVYLYAASGYKPGTAGYPRYTAESVADLSKLKSFDNLTKSIDIVNPDTTTPLVAYRAVVFEDQNWRGRCAFVPYPLADTDQSAISGNYTDRVSGISSIIVSRTIINQFDATDRGKVILYTKANCGKSDTDPTKQIKKCSIPIGTEASGQSNIFKNDPEGKCPFESGDEVMSLEITGPAGIVLSTAKKDEVNSGTRCQYFSKKDLNQGTCVSIIGSSVYTVGGVNPKSFIIIPDN